MNWKTDRVRIAMDHKEMMKLIGIYLKEHSDWQESIKEAEDALTEEEYCIANLGNDNHKPYSEYLEGK